MGEWVHRSVDRLIGGEMQEDEMGEVYTVKGYING
jgi:hypothetical protein